MKSLIFLVCFMLGCLSISAGVRPNQTQTQEPFFVMGIIQKVEKKPDSAVWQISVGNVQPLLGDFKKQQFEIDVYEGQGGIILAYNGKRIDQSEWLGKKVLILMHEGVKSYSLPINTSCYWTPNDQSFFVCSSEEEASLPDLQNLLDVFTGENTTENQNRLLGCIEDENKAAWLRIKAVRKLIDFRVHEVKDIPDVVTQLRKWRDNQNSSVEVRMGMDDELVHLSKEYKSSNERLVFLKELAAKSNLSEFMQKQVGWKLRDVKRLQAEQK